MYFKFCMKVNHSNVHNVFSLKASAKCDETKSSGSSARPLTELTVLSMPVVPRTAYSASHNLH